MSPTTSRGSLRLLHYRRHAASFEGIVTLLSQLLVAPDALGRSIHAQVDSDSFEIIFPAMV
jgi:hypothetical protein